MEKDVEKLIIQLQMLNQQLQSVLVQKQTLMLHNTEIEHAMEEIKDNTGKVFSIIGPVLIEKENKSVKQDLNERKEETELRIKTLEKQEKMLKDKIKELQEKFKEMQSALGTAE